MNEPQSQQVVAFSPFVNSIYDIGGLMTLLEEISLIQRTLFRGKEGLISQNAKDFTTGNIITIFEELEKTGLEPVTDQKQMKFLQDLVVYVKKLPIVKVSIAFEPTNTFLIKLNSQISVVLGKKIILDIVINQYLVGGAVFEYSGKVGRYTLDNELENVLKKLVDQIDLGNLR